MGSLAGTCYLYLPLEREQQCFRRNSFVAMIERSRGFGFMSMRKGGEQNTTEILPGLLDMLILQLLEQGALHGYALAEAIHADSNQTLKVPSGSLYPALHRLRRKGWVSAEWKKSEIGPPSLVYRLTESGGQRLIAERSRWRNLIMAIQSVIKRAKMRSRSKKVTCT